MKYSNHQEIISGYLNLLTSGVSNLMIVLSSAGYGKTTLTLNEIEKLPKGSWQYINNYITPIEFYQILSKTNQLKYPKILILDDIEYSLANKEFQGLLKAATWEVGKQQKRVVNYVSGHYKVKDLPTIEFDGKIIVLLNDLPKRQGVLKAVLDRALFYELRMNNDEILQAMKEVIVPQPFGTLTQQQRTRVWKFIKDNTTANDHISFRTLIQAYRCYQYAQYSWVPLTKSLIKQHYDKTN